MMQKILNLQLGLPESKYIVKKIMKKGEIKVGDVLLLIEDNNGTIIEYSCPVNGINFYPLIIENDMIISGQSIYTYEIIIDTTVQSYIDDKIWDLAIATNAVFKGLLGSMGQSGQIASRTVKLKTELNVKNGIERLLDDISNSFQSLDENDGLQDGDVVVVAEKPYAVAQNRLLPIKYIYDRDPKKMIESDRKEYLKEVSLLLNSPMEEEDLILADAYTDDPGLGMMCTMGAYNHNLLAHLTAEKIREKTGKSVDVVISDTDTGIDVRKMIIGCITLGATPIGATKGLSLYECMRAACAAEFGRGSKYRIPIIICKPAERCRNRIDMGEYRGYDGKLKYSIEGKIAFD